MAARGRGVKRSQTSDRMAGTSAHLYLSRPVQGSRQRPDLVRAQPANSDAFAVGALVRAPRSADRPPAEPDTAADTVTGTFAVQPSKPEAFVAMLPEHRASSDQPSTKGQGRPRHQQPRPDEGSPVVTDLRPGIFTPERGPTRASQ